MTRLTVQQVLDADLADWRKLNRSLHARFLTGDFATSVRLVEAVSEAAEAANHHPDVTLTYPWVDLTLVSHDVGHVTERDVDLARTISDLARELGVEAAPHAATVVEVGLDTWDIAALGPVWAALVTGDAGDHSGDEVVDPDGHAPSLWFQPTEAHDEPRQRFHLDIWVPHDVAEQRIAAAVSTGATVVDDTHAPSFVVLADPQGNKACICTFLDRDQDG